MTPSDEPQRIVAALVAAGWVAVGRGPHHVRLQHPDDDYSLMVPTDPTAPEYGQLVDALIAHLGWHRDLGIAAGNALNTLTAQGVIV